MAKLFAVLILTLATRTALVESCACINRSVIDAYGGTWGAQFYGDSTGPCYIDNGVKKCYMAPANQGDPFMKVSCSAECDAATTNYGGSGSGSGSSAPPPAPSPPPPQVVGTVNSAKCTQAYDNVLHQTEKDALLARHNELRGKIAKKIKVLDSHPDLPYAKNMIKLEWNDTLAQSAQAWANECTAGHGMDDGVGQNYWATFGTSCTTMNYNYPVDSWYSEVKDMDESKIDNYPYGQTSPVVGHFTQVAWAKTAQVGCGYIEYKINRQWTDPQTNEEWTFTCQKAVVCNYYVPGNLGTNAVYEKGSVESDIASNCPSGYSKESGNTGLCSK